MNKKAKKKKKVVRGYEDKNIHSYYDTDQSKLLSNARQIAIGQLTKHVNVTGTIVDVGCGTGNALLEIFQKFSFDKFYGLDLSREMLNIAKTKIPHLTDICDSGLNLYKYFQEPTADLLNLHFLFAYLDYQQLIQQASKIIKKGGLLSICTNTRNSLLNIQQLSVQYLAPILKLLSFDLRACQQKYFNLLPDANSLTAVLEEHGFQVEELDVMKQQIKVNNWREAWDFTYNAGWFSGEMQHDGIGKYKLFLMFTLLKMLYHFSEKKNFVEDEMEILVVTARKK